jgi:transcriptional regulator with XRE-family HTH domain
VTQQQIANELGITLEAVNQVVTGRRNIYRVIDALVAAGVPKWYFPDARRTRKADSEANKEV